MPKNLDIEFLEFLEPDDGIPKEMDITPFIMKNFPIPNLEDFNANYYHTDALIFLKKTEQNGRFFYYEDSILPILLKEFHEVKGKKYRVWFNDLDTKTFARITDSGIEHLYNYRTNEILKITNQSIVDTNIAVKTSIYVQIGVGIITMIAIVLTAIYTVTSYYKNDSENLILIRKSMQRQDSTLQNIQLLQKERNTYLKTMAEKGLSKNPN